MLLTHGAMVPVFVVGPERCCCTGPGSQQARPGSHARPCSLPHLDQHLPRLLAAGTRHNLSHCPRPVCCQANEVQAVNQRGSIAEWDCGRLPLQQRSYRTEEQGGRYMSALLLVQFSVLDRCCAAIMAS